MTLTGPQDLMAENAMSQSRCIRAASPDPGAQSTDGGLQGIVYDVTGNKAYQPGGSYHGG